MIISHMIALVYTRFRGSFLIILGSDDEVCDDDANIDHYNYTGYGSNVEEWLVDDDY